MSAADRQFECAQLMRAARTQVAAERPDDGLRRTAVGARFKTLWLRARGLPDPRMVQKSDGFGRLFDVR